MRKLQSIATIREKIPLMKADGTPLIGEDTDPGTTLLFTTLTNSAGQAVIGYTEATFSEPDGDGNYGVEFLLNAPDLAFTEEDQANPYFLTLNSTNPDAVASVPVPIRIVSQYLWEIPTNPLNILSATGYVKNIYWASGGKYFVKESEDIDIPFGFEGNPTGLKLWFVIGKDLKNAPLIKKELIEGIDWNVVDIDGIDTVEGIIPFAYADTDTLHGKYTAAAIVKTSSTEAYTGWESLLIVDRPVARAEDLV